MAGGFHLIGVDGDLGWPRRKLGDILMVWVLE